MNTKSWDHEKKFRCALGSVLLLTAITYVPALFNQFTNWDDPNYLLKNASVRSFSWQNLQAIYSDPVTWFYGPLSILMYIPEYHLFGLNPAGYHTVNVLLHLANTALVFYFIHLLSKKNIYVAAFTAALFAVHPMHVEPVAWVTGQRDLLFSFFYLASLISYLRFIKNKSIVAYGLAFLFYVLSVMLKAVGITLPIVLVLIDVYLERRFTKEVLIEKARFFYTAFFLALLTAGIYMFWRPDKLSSTPIEESILLPCYSVIFYLMKLVAPVNLAGVYPMPVLDEKLVSVAACLVLGALLYKNRGSKALIFGSGFFITLLLPVLQIFPTLPMTVVADRYTYLAYVGLFFPVVLFIQKLSKKQKFWVWALVPALLIFSALSMQRCTVWKNGFTLWSDVIQKYPEVATAHNNRGNEYGRRKEYGKAIADFSRAIELYPAYASAYNNRGYAYSFLGEHDIAIADYTAAIKLDPTVSGFVFNRAGVFFAKNDYENAVKDYLATLSLDPSYAEVYNNLGYIYALQGKKDAALKNYNSALAIKPNYADALNNRGNFYRNQGSVQLALNDYSQAIRIDGTQEKPYFNRGNTYAEQGQLDLALYDLEMVLRLNPSHAEALNNLGNVRSMLGQPELALENFNRAIQVAPTNADAYNNRGYEYYLKKDYVSAIKDYDKAIELRPNFQLAIRNRQAAMAAKAGKR